VVVVKAPVERADEVESALLRLGTAAQADPLFAHDAAPEVNRSPNGTVSLLTIGTTSPAGTDGADESLRRLRAT
jgi:RND superfamily putative drug exporter